MQCCTHRDVVSCLLLTLMTLMGPTALVLNVARMSSGLMDSMVPTAGIPALLASPPAENTALCCSPQLCFVRPKIHQSHVHPLFLWKCFVSHSSLKQIRCSPTRNYFHHSWISLGLLDYLIPKMRNLFFFFFKHPQTVCLRNMQAHYIIIFCYSVIWTDLYVHNCFVDFYCLPIDTLNYNKYSDFY
jgi:hypothetical protein